MNQTKYSVFTVVFSIFITLIILEIFFRFMPVKDGLYYQDINEHQPLPRYEIGKDFIWSQRWNFLNINKGKINNDGFINNQNYLTESPEPLISIIGDSYIESRMVPYEETVQGRLSKSLTDKYRVYSFAADGSPLSNYLIFAKYAAEKYKTDKLIFFIVGNDFINSFPEYYLQYGHHQFFKGDDNVYSLDRALDYNKSTLSWLLQRSSLLRYTICNLRIDRYFKKIKRTNYFKKAKKRYSDLQYIGPIISHHNQTKYSDQSIGMGKLSIDLFLKFLPDYAHIDKENILFVLDAHTGEIPPTYHYIMSQYMQNQLEKEGYKYIDMNPIFRKHYAELNTSLHIPFDRHLNGIAHNYIKDAVLESGFLQ